MSVVEPNDEELHHSDYLTWRDENLIDKQAEMENFKEVQNQTFTQIFELQDQLAKEAENRTAAHNLKVEIARLSRKIAEIAVEMELTNLQIDVLDSVGSFEVYDQAMQYLDRIRNAQLEIVNCSEFLRVEN